MKTRLFFILLLSVLQNTVCTFSYAATSATSDAVYGEELQGFIYPYPVHQFQFESQRQNLHMAYMDLLPQHPNGHTVVLLHGKNFCAATWQETMRVLSDAGYRVIAPDQIGFCSSAKPLGYQFSFQQLARNTHDLLISLGIHQVTIIGHSTGGMLGVRYALMYPDDVSQLVLVDPIGLEDWKAKGVPWQSVDAWRQQELRVNIDSIRDYERATYYAGTWAPAFERWADMLAGMNSGPGKEIVAWNSALLYDMIYTQPVFYEFGKLQPPVLLMIGDKDNTAIGKMLAPPSVRATLGDYPALGNAAAKAIPNCRLVEFPDLGHAPQIQAPDVFHAALMEGLRAKP